MDDEIFQQSPFQHKPSNDWQGLYQSPTVRGGFIGAIITAFVSWNTGRNGRIGKFMKRWRFIRFFIEPKYLKVYCPITDYHYPCLDIAANNFYCYSGQSGIGTSRHFQEIVAKQSRKRPSLYLSFKAVGREANFENDLIQQLNYGQGNWKGGIVGELVKAIKKLQLLNQRGQYYRKMYYLGHLAFLSMYGLTAASPLPLELQIALLLPCLLSQCYYYNFMQPIMLQIKRATVPVIVFDDLNKLEHLGMLAQITRFFKIIQAKAANIMLISSTEQTWAKLRRQPGMKDRLRVRHVRYDHDDTCHKIIQLLQSNPDLIKQYFTAHPLFNDPLFKEMVRTFIGAKRMTIRRFASLLKLVDEEQYQALEHILKNEDNHPAVFVVEAMCQVIFRTEVKTMVTNFRSIKRQLASVSQKHFTETLEAVVRNGKLPSDSKIGSLLRVYNILRDLRSQYVINGGYMTDVFEVALQTYKEQMQLYQLPQHLQDIK